MLQKSLAIVVSIIFLVLVLSVQHEPANAQGPIHFGATEIHNNFPQDLTFQVIVSRDEGENWEKTKTLEDDPDGWYCYTAIEFVGNFVLLGHCAGNRKMNNGLETTQITRLNLNLIFN